MKAIYDRIEALEQRVHALEQDRMADHDRRLRRLEGAQREVDEVAFMRAALGDQRETVSVHSAYDGWGVRIPEDEPARVGQGFHPPHVCSHRIPVRIPEDDDGAKVRGRIVPPNLLDDGHGDGESL